MFPTTPKVRDIFQSHFFEDPLIPIGSEPTSDENSALAGALLSYSKRSRPDDYSSLVEFVDANPDSPWIASLLTCLGLEYYNTGHYSKTMDAWRNAWMLASEVDDLNGKALADCAIGELAYMYARLGRVTELEDLLTSIKDRILIGRATEKITSAREGLWVMQNRPEIAFRCGPLALQRIKLSTDPLNTKMDLIHFVASTSKGCSLLQIHELSKELDLNFEMVFREENTEFVIPSVIHLKVDHYAALVRYDGDRYLLQDSTFGNDHWITREALEAEGSGYFLIPSEELGQGWRVVDRQEGGEIWGKGYVLGHDPNPHAPCDPATPTGGDSCPSNNSDCKGMAVSRVHLMLVSLNINDEPVGYSPPIGPAVRFTVRYNQREFNQPPHFNYSNLGQKWTFDWLSYIKDDPNPSHPASNVEYYIMGGGTRIFEFEPSTSSYKFQQYDQTKLTRTTFNTYEMLSKDGSRKIFSQSDGSPAASTSRKIFLTKVIDPFGNAVLLHYDQNLRLDKITDAIGQVTTITYSDDPIDYKIKRVTDPFGRFATFEYDASNRLIKITDVAHMTSEFAYEGDFITTLTTLTTPYEVTTPEVTTFTKGEDGTTRWLETTYPDGNRDRVEFNQSTELGIPISTPFLPIVDSTAVPGGMRIRNYMLFYRNTFYWSKKAYAEAHGDYTKSKIYHWLHFLPEDPNMPIAAGILESIKEPLEGRVWYDYSGQNTITPSGPMYTGNTNKPSHVGRVLDDGSTQLYTYEYNNFGNATKYIDPVGRTFSYLYAQNGIDLLEIRQTRAGQSELLLQVQYNTRHQPLTIRDAAGQSTTYTYYNQNHSGQVRTVRNARNETLTYRYYEDAHANGYRRLKSIDGPLPGQSTILTYDSFGRVLTRTDESGYVLTFDYDNLDRLTKITYPDGTFDQYTFTRLDVTLIRDRAGRETKLEYNNVRQIIKRTDPLNRITLFQWCKCGALRSITDPMGRTTTWRHDIQGRLKSKEYVDGSKITYLYENLTSRLRQRIDEKLQVTQYNYNMDDTVSRISYSNAVVATPSVAFTYDANYSRLSSMIDGTGTTYYRYIPITPIPSLGAGQLSSEQGPLPNSTITYTYDELGRRVSTAIDGVVSSVTYDGAGRIVTNTNALGVFHTTYDGASFRKVSESYPNGQSTEFEYGDNLHDQHLQRITNKQGATLISKFIYDHNVPTGQITSWSQQAEGQIPLIYSLGYDPVDQLISASVSEGGIVVKSFDYSYDPVGNRLTEQINATSRQFFYNALNELTSVENDANLPVTYQWDAENRLISITSDNQTTVFAYDGFGRRIGIQFSVNGLEVSNRRFLWCDKSICEERTADSVVSKRFFHNGVKVESGIASNVYFYSRDHLGSIRELTDSSGTIIASYSYDAFGKRSLVTGDMDTDFGFAGMFWLSDVALSLTLFRAYDPNIGRWLSRDALASTELLQTTKLYTYVDNNPINLIDLYGLQKVQPKSTDTVTDECLDLLGVALSLAACYGCGLEMEATWLSLGFTRGASLGSFIGSGGGNFCKTCFSPGLNSCSHELPPNPTEPDNCQEDDPACFYTPQLNMCIAPNMPKIPEASMPEY